ncbi:asparagine synthase-related protein [Sphingomonas suaedae]|uniref:asparagine synthase-related protein n=1 Tax=Sphingomonas suaedae TaxID=2599297 RepID=UPI001648CB43|nr:asparagine synthase-related protein [Sphingomonas suaedae]
MTALAAAAFVCGPDAPVKLCERLLALQPVAREVPAFLWDRGAVALGRRLAATLPEDAFDRGIARGRGGALAMAADIRLDNRDDLAAALGCVDTLGRLSDAALAMSAIERWGVAAIEGFLGDFAIVLWDGSHDRLILARDALGARPLHYRRTGGCVTVASTAQALASAAGARADGIATVHFLSGMAVPHGASFFAGIERVEPGEIVTIGAHSLDRSSYWNPDLSPSRFASGGDAAEALAALFGESVRARLRRTAADVATHLSAGLDSGAVTATAARRIGDGSVHAFTAAPPEGMHGADDGVDDEGPDAAKLAAMHPRIVHHRIASPRRSPVDMLGPGFVLYGRPLTNLANQTWLAEINDRIRAQGVDVLLVGAMGNLTISHSGSEALGELVRSGRIARAIRHGAELRAAGNSWRAVAGAATRPFRNSPPQKWGPPLLAPGVSRPQADAVLGSVARRLAVARRTDPGDFGKAVLAGWDIDMRDPTADRRIVEFCLRLPVERFAPGGVARGLARTAFADCLPASTIASHRRGRQAGWWHVAAREKLDRIRDEIECIAASTDASAIVDVATMREMVATWPGRWSDPQTEARYRMRLLPALAAGHFVRRCAA